MSIEFVTGGYAVLPGHGLVRFNRVETRATDSGSERYYSLEEALTGARILLPSNKWRTLRTYASIDDCRFAAKIASSNKRDISDISWEIRQKQCAAKISSGDVISLAEVIRDLRARQRVQPLCFGELEALRTASTCLMQELLVVLPVSEYNALRLNT